MTFSRKLSRREEARPRRWPLRRPPTLRGSAASARTRPGKKEKKHQTHSLRPVERVDGRDRNVRRRHERARRLHDGARRSDGDELGLDVHALGLHVGANRADVPEVFVFVFLKGEKEKERRRGRERGESPPPFCSAYFPPRNAGKERKESRKPTGGRAVFRIHFLCLCFSREAEEKKGRKKSVSVEVWGRRERLLSLRPVTSR